MTFCHVLGITAKKKLRTAFCTAIERNILEMTRVTNQTGRKVCRQRHTISISGNSEKGAHFSIEVG